MKASRYNFVVERIGAGAAIFNARTGAYARITSETASAVRWLLAHPEAEGIRLPALARLRERLRDRGFLIDADLDEVAEVARHKMDAQHKTDGLELTVAVTMQCNFSCTYCYENHNNEHMEEATCRALVRFVRSRLPRGTRLSVTWFGGEPLLNLKAIRFLTGEFRQVCQELECTYEADMITNGYRLDDAMVADLADLQVMRFQVTLDGDAETHDRSRPLLGGQGTFARIWNNLETVAGKVDALSIRINLTRDNVASTRRLLARINASSKLRDRVSAYVAPVDDSGGEAFNGSDLLAKAEFAHLEADLAWDIADGKAPESEPPTPVGSICCADRVNAFVVGQNGDLYKCWNSLGRPEDAIGHIEDASVDEMASQWLTVSAADDPECRACAFLPICQGGCPDVSFRSGGAKKDCTTYKFTLEQALLGAEEPARTVTPTGPATVPTGDLQRWAGTGL